MANSISAFVSVFPPLHIRLLLKILPSHYSNVDDDIEAEAKKTHINFRLILGLGFFWKTEGDFNRLNYAV